MKTACELPIRTLLFPSRLESEKRICEELASSVPSADLPYYVDQIDSSGGHIFKWEYGSNREPRRKLSFSDLDIIYGRNSGCLYQACVDSDTLKSIGLLEESVMSEVSKLSRTNKRFENNFRYGFSVLLHLCNEQSPYT